MVLEVRRGMGSLAWLLAGAALACGGSGGPADAGADALGPDGSMVVPPDIPWLEDGVPPIAAPDLGPCPDGWRAVADEGGVTTCDPYPEGGALDCPAGQAHFPGEPGCAPVGAPCPAGDFSETLPADRNIVYVQPGASGDGSSPASPYGSFLDFGIGGLPSMTVVALSRGTHVGPVRLARGVAVWGACAAETRVTTSAGGDTSGVVEIRDATGEIRDLTVADSPRPGVVLVGDGTEGLLEGVVVEGTQSLALVAVNDAVLTVHDAVVRDTQSRGRDARFGRGANIESGGTMHVSRAIFEGNRDIGIFVGDADTAVTLTDVVVRDTLAETVDGTAGRGLEIELGPSVEVTRALFEGNRHLAVLAASPGTAVTLADVVIRDTLAQESDGMAGRGLVVQGGAVVQADRALVERNRGVGVFVAEPDAELTLTDVIVRDTRERDRDGTGGRGLALQEGARVAVTRAIFERNGEAGIFAGDIGTVLTVADVVVRGTRGRVSDGKFGRGLGVQLGATADVTRSLFDGTRDIGVFVAGSGTAVSLADVVVRDTRARMCADTTCMDAPAGHGMGSFLEASLSASRFVVARSALCGAQVALDGSMDLSNGEVRGSPIGVCLQVSGYDLDRLTGGVGFVDNEVNLDSTTLPVPETAAAVPDVS